MSIYLDYNATAPLRPEVLDILKEVLQGPANPSSVHALGRRAKKYVEDARKTIADAISCWPDELIFTATGTEANTTALGCARGRILISAVEHSSIIRHSGESRNPEKPSRLDTGVRRYDVIPVDSHGIVKLDALEKMLTEQKPALVSIMLANNETGVIQPIPEIAAICKKHGALLHTDAAQALGKITVDVGALGVDMLTLSAHKCGGPVGAAVLIVRRGVNFTPLFSGGGQEGRRRAGTENVAAIAGFGRAVENFDFAHMKKLRGWLDEMESKLVGATVFGKNAPRLPNTSCVAMPNVSNEVQLMDFDLNGYCVSAGSACSSGRVETSHVLLAMGVPEKLASTAIRISGGWNTKESEIKDFTSAWLATCERLATKNAIA